MISKLQILGIVIPIFIILFLFIESLIQVLNKKGDEIAPLWMVLLLFLSIFIFGFTFVTIIMS